MIELDRVIETLREQAVACGELAKESPVNNSEYFLQKAKEYEYAAQILADFERK